MNKYFLIDTGFWIALFFKDDKYHEIAKSVFKKINRGKIVIPWPTLYELLRTKFVKFPDKLNKLQDIFIKDNFFKIDDEQYKNNALNITFNDNINYRKESSLVDNLISEMLKDINLRIDYLITFDNRANFNFYCKKRSILLINEFTHSQLLK